MRGICGGIRLRMFLSSTPNRAQNSSLPSSSSISTHSISQVLPNDLAKAFTQNIPHMMNAYPIPPMAGSHSPAVSHMDLVTSTEGLIPSFRLEASTPTVPQKLIGSENFPPRGESLSQAELGLPSRSSRPRSSSKAQKNGNRQGDLQGPVRANSMTTKDGAQSQYSYPSQLRAFSTSPQMLP
ncbi:hypothetical protein M011DRAFT_285961 [Sporormia fimetaria CBS 119925]|uniref:Uncharacterized protein n=1 Tax=Sporormia fimetaria CBS 119925 TaxID=1340428 RepID=A0A6A6VJV5_9PLEO|nr:hypothetical protein M011DRAFT_285961 [Sporormia fimetaria CBS 119925]